MKSVTHLEKVITGEVSAVTHLEQVIAEETAAVTYTERVIAGAATPVTHLQKVIAGIASPVTHLEHIWAGRTPEPTEHEYTGAVPVEILANGEPLLDWSIKGNTVQNGTPTTTTPIQPSECGERTANLWNLIFTSGYNLNQNTGLPEVYTPNNTRMAILSPVDVTQYNTVTFNYTNETTNTLCMMYSKFSNGNILQRVANLQIPVTIDVSEADSLYICVYNVSSHDAVTDDSISNIMLNTGSTALPYEPYGYKIPISSANTTTNVYLGEVQSTRKIGKYIFTGEENITRSASGNNTRMYYVLSEALASSALYCTHFEDNGQGSVYPPIGKCYLNAISNFIMGVDGTEFETADDFKAWLRTQYTNGNPLTVWYVLATPETATINEPLMKIGGYADSISMEQAGASIPTVSGTNVIDVETTLKPSEVYLKYKG